MIMPPEFRDVYIPDGLPAELFRALVPVLGGFIGSEEQTQSEIDREKQIFVLPAAVVDIEETKKIAEKWQSETALLRPLVATIRGPEPENIVAINRNIESLLKKAFARSARYRLKEEYPVSFVRASLADWFEDSLPEDVPVGVFLQTRNNQEYFSRTVKSGNMLLPQHIRWLIEGYGLITGTPMSVEDMAQSQNITPTNMVNNLNTAIKRIESYQPIRDLATEPKH